MRASGVVGVCPTLHLLSKYIDFDYETDSLPRDVAAVADDHVEHPREISDEEIAAFLREAAPHLREVEFFEHKKSDAELARQHNITLQRVAEIRANGRHIVRTPNTGLIPRTAGMRPCTRPRASRSSARRIAVRRAAARTAARGSPDDDPEPAGGRPYDIGLRGAA